MSKRATGEGAETGTRRYGEGSISQRGEKFRAQAAVGGRRVSETFPTRQAAKAWLRKVLTDADSGLLPADGGKVTVGAFLDRWLEATKPSIKPKTYQQYESVIRLHARPTLGTMRLAALRPDHLQTLYAAKLAAGLSARTVRLIHSVVGHALRDAVRWGLAPRNVATATTPPRPRRAEMKVWTPDQARAFLAGVRGERLEPAYRLLLSCGLRQGELLGLRWEDVDLDAGRLHIRRTLQRLGQGAGIVVGEPKTARARRQIVLPAGVVDALRRWRVQQLEDRLLAGPKWRETGFLITSSVGTALEASTLLRDFERRTAQLGLPRIRVHDMRHTCATVLLSQDVHPKIVQELLGHSNIAMTMDLYSHVLPTMQEQAARTMERVLSG